MHRFHPVSLLTVFLFLFLFPVSSSSQTPQTAAVEVSATATPGGIVFTWPPDPLANSYAVFRKLKTEPTFSPFATAILADTATTWTDTSATVSSAYEYHFQKFATGWQGHGYIWAGNETPAIEGRGRILLLIDSTITPSISPEIAQLTEDLRGDGWKVSTLLVDRADAVADVKTKIVDEAASHPDLNTIYIIGHVPVPYSGNLAPDGHIPDHQGAWPADVFYGELNNTWTDATVNNIGASRPQNHNIPGDGKYDQTTLPGDIELAVGRLDFYDMPILGGDESLLLKRYLNRAHDWRMKKFTAAAEGIVDDNFGYFSGESFATNGWGNFAPLVGAANVRADDYITGSASPTLLSYGCGGGTYTSAGGIGSSSDFAVDTLNSVFSMLFGSYLGDWDSQDNFMRSALGTNGNILSMAWAGRPHWHFHHIGLGETTGYSMLKSANNSSLYFSSFFARTIHIALMGDPAVRMSMIAPPSALTVTPVDSDHNNQLTWTASAEPVAGYYIYRAPHIDSTFVRITPAEITDTTYTDSCLLAGDYVYLVRALALSTSGSGTYYNLSQGIFGAASNAPDYTLNYPATDYGDHCPGDTLFIAFTAPGGFCASNTFSAELSDETGSFAAPLLIGSISSTTSGVITAVIPAGLTPSGAYRIRVSAGSPSATTPDNGFDMALTTPPVAGFTYIQYGDSIAFVSSSSNGDLLSWNFGDGFNGSGDSIGHNFAGGSYTVTLIASNFCGADTSTTLVTIIGIKDALSGGSITAFPNPFSGQFRLHTTLGLNEVQISITDLQGRVLHTRHITHLGPGYDPEMLLPAMPAGYLLLQITALEGRYVMPLIHQ